jgi:cytochrome c-type biogenesis protein
VGTGLFEAQPSQVSLIAAFLAGLVSFVSPCVLPLVPSYVTFITGLSFDELTGEQGPRVRRLTLIHSLAFIFGFSLVFIALGATATATGQFLREHQDTLRIVGGVLIVFFGIYLTGLVKIPALSRERKVHLTGKPLGVLGSVLVGITFAAGWTPCIGPILASILLYASTAQTVGTGILLLSVYSLGLGVPFLIASLGMNTFLSASKGIRKQLHTIEVVSGVILIVFGLALVTNLFGHFVAFLSRFLPAVG